MRISSSLRVHPINISISFGLHWITEQVSVAVVYGHFVVSLFVFFSVSIHATGNERAACTLTCLLDTGAGIVYLCVSVGRRSGLKSNQSKDTVRATWELGNFLLRSMEYVGYTSLVLLYSEVTINNVLITETLLEYKPKHQHST